MVRYLQRATNRKSNNGLSNSAIFNDLEKPQTQFPRTLNVSETAEDTAIVTIECE